MQLVVSFLLTLALNFPHPFHLSVMEVALSQSKQSLQISQRMFVDDLEDALKVFSGDETLDILKKLPDSVLSNYLTEKRSFWINGQAVNPKYLGFEFEDGTIWVYAEATGLEIKGLFSFQNSVLLEIFEDQENLTHVKFGDKQKTFRCNEDQSKFQIALFEK